MRTTSAARRRNCGVKTYKRTMQLAHTFFDTINTPDMQDDYVNAERFPVRLCGT